MSKPIRILLIDDSQEAIDAITPFILDVELDKQIICVDTQCLLVKFEKINDEYVVSDETIKELSHLCDAKFDFIFTDYSYIANKEQHDIVQRELIEKRAQAVSEDDLKRATTLKLLDIRKGIDRLSADGKNANVIKKLKKNFLNHKKNVYLYTRYERPFESLFSSSERPRRLKELKKCLEHAQVDTIIVQQRYGVPPGCDMDSCPQKPNNPDKSVIYKLTGDQINGIVRQKAYERIANLNKLYRIPKLFLTLLTVFTITGTMGYVSSFVGGVLANILTGSSKLSTWEVVSSAFFSSNIWYVLLIALMLSAPSTALVMLLQAFADRLYVWYSKDSNNE